MPDFSDLSVLQWLLAGWAVSTCLLWLAAAGRILRGMRVLAYLKDQSPPEPDEWPKLSVIISACNEADTLADAMRTLLAQDYPNLEVVLVNDRSTDGTDRVVDDLAARDDRIVPVHIDELPDGWLGKTHALEQARRRATGQWLLFTDADVHFEASTIRTAIASCLERELDHLAVIPAVRAQGFWLRVTMAAGVLPTLLKLPIQRVSDHGGRTAIGAGAFNLVRAARLEESGGFEPIRLEIADDYALAWQLKQRGARAAVLGGAERIWLTWYPSLSALIRRMDKSFYAMRFSYARLAAALLVGGWFVAGPLIGLAAVPLGGVRLLAGVAYLALTSAAVVSGRRLDWPAWPGVLLPIGFAIMLLGLLRGGINCRRRGGLIWRGTLYPVETLREAQQIKF